MDLEQAYRLAPTTASDGDLEDGEVHSENEVPSSINLQGLSSSIAEMLEGGAKRDVQAQGVALAPEHAPIESAATSGGQSNANKLVLDNYLSVDGVGQVLLDQSVELRGCDLPQSRGDDAQTHRNLVLAYAACECQVRGCRHQIAI